MEGKNFGVFKCLLLDVDIKVEIYVNGCIFIKNNWLDREVE